MKEFFYIGGYGYYVWSAYGLSLVVLALNAITARSQLRRAGKELQRSENVPS